MQITMTVNGVSHTRDVEARLLLIHFLRDDLGLTGSHWGCDTSNCGACVVWLDETPVKSCTVLAAMADGHRVRTVEDLARGGRAGPGPAGLRGVPRAAVRVLHAGHDDDRPVAARPHTRSRPRRRSARPCPASCAGAPATRTSCGPSSGPAEHAGRPAARAGRARGRPAGGGLMSAAPIRPATGPTARCGARRTPGSCAARARSWTTSGGPACCTARSCAARWRTPGSCAWTPPPRRPTPGSGPSSPARCCSSASWPGCPPCPVTSRPCWPPTRSGSRARRSRSSSPRTATRPGTRSS